MPSYKPIDTGMKMLHIDLSVQLLPGTFDHALSHLLDHELDLRVLDERFKNHESGAPGYALSVLLKVVLFAYSRGMIRSRDISTACQENVTFMVLSGDGIPYFTTIATFVRELKDEIADIFAQVLFTVRCLGSRGCCLEQPITKRVTFPSCGQIEVQYDPPEQSRSRHCVVVSALNPP